jgi:hypothetical protein
MAFTPKDEEFIRLQASLAAALDVMQLLTHTLASVGPDSHGRLIQGLDRIHSAAGNWTLKGASSPEESMLYGQLYEEQAQWIASGLRKMLLPGDFSR